MDKISAADVLSVVGRVDDLLLRELIRTEASSSELRQAVQVARSTNAGSDPGQDTTLSLHMRASSICAASAPRGPLYGMASRQAQMQPEPRSFVDEAVAANGIRHAMMTAFCAVLHRSGMPPMTLLRLAALAVGSVYREVAEAHQGLDACPCGWEPQTAADIAVMQDAVAEAAQPQLCADLVRIETAGSA